jgi:hypothetical protein
MLANILAVLLGLASVTFYMAAFFYPEVHRRADPVWSGLGLFYALILWFCAGQMTVAVLLSQLVVVALLIGLGWQTLSVRREKTPVYQQTPVVITPEIVGDWAKNKLNQLRIAPAAPVPIRLEKRTFSEFSSDRLDPRRRPVYDYEFVEDGLAEDGLTEDGLTEEAIAADNDAIAANPENVAPPAAIAEILSVEIPEPVEEPEAPEPEASEPAIDEPDSEKPTQSTQPPAGRPKPHLLAMPLVLVGWIKDVVSSFTKPKPSKPVIDIPRREPAMRSPASQDTQTIDSAPSQPETSTDSSWDEDPEDSNWDD